MIIVRTYHSKRVHIISYNSFYYYCSCLVQRSMNTKMGSVCITAASQTDAVARISIWIEWWIKHWRIVPYLELGNIRTSNGWRHRRSNHFASFWILIFSIHEEIAFAQNAVACPTLMRRAMLKAPNPFVALCRVKWDRIRNEPTPSHTVAAAVRRVFLVNIWWWWRWRRWLLFIRNSKSWINSWLCKIYCCVLEMWLSIWTRWKWF